MINNEHKSSNFWFGFALGTIGAVASSYLLGTKNGRKKLQQILDITENLEDNLDLLTTELKKELKKVGDKEEQAIEEKLPQVIDSVGSMLQAKTQEQKNNTKHKQEKKPMSDILQRMSNLTTPLQSLPKKFIIKDTQHSA